MEPITKKVVNLPVHIFETRQEMGKAAAADATVSSLAKAAGWDETVWDLSGNLPVLKK